MKVKTVMKYAASSGTTFFLIVLLAGVFLTGMAKDGYNPYAGYTGTVHHFGFVAGYYNIGNSGQRGIDSPSAFHNYGVGAVYNLHDYATRQITIDLLTSLTVMTAKEIGGNRQRVTWPVEGRLCIGPSEDVQIYVGAGLQWNMHEKPSGGYFLVRGDVKYRAVHQLGSNVAIGMHLFGPQNYMVHINAGMKFHYVISDDGGKTITGFADMSKDRDCVIVEGGVTVDIDKKKKACLMLNYEQPLAAPKSSVKKGFFSNTKTISLGLLFRIGGSR